MSEVLSLGVDLGGTKTEAAVLRRPSAGAADSGEFEVVFRERVPTPGNQGYAAVLESTVELIQRLAAKAGCALNALPIGVGMPGAVTRREGLVKNSNTVCLNGRPFREDVSRALGTAVAFENDANCFALAEARLGAAREHQEGVVFGVIMGTGVGGGLVVQGKVWQGLQHLGGEWGHHAVGPWRSPSRSAEAVAGRASGFALGERGACYCGKTGCLELYASGPAVEQDYLRRSGAARKLPEIAARRAEDVHANAALEEMLEAFARGLANVIDIVDPSAVVLGGGVSNLALLYDEGRERLARYVFNDELLTPVLKHQLGDSAGVIGAALLQG
ncbi:MAG TPA: ROK family protein [Polyangiaceae bacterium]|jgi:fructokinase|nr:ROK family protein [Polyangiaceae bacterium]